MTQLKVIEHTVEIVTVGPRCGRTCFMLRDRPSLSDAENPGSSRYVVAVDRLFGTLTLGGFE